MVTTVRVKEALEAVQAPLGRKEATCGALIPIKKSAAWWELIERYKVTHTDWVPTHFVRLLALTVEIRGQVMRP